MLRQIIRWSRGVKRASLSKKFRASYFYSITGQCRTCPLEPRPSSQNIFLWFLRFQVDEFWQRDFSPKCFHDTPIFNAHRRAVAARCLRVLRKPPLFLSSRGVFSHSTATFTSCNECIFHDAAKSACGFFSRIKTSALVTAT